MKKYCPPLQGYLAVLQQVHGFACGHDECIGQRTDKEGRAFVCEYAPQGIIPPVRRSDADGIKTVFGCPSGVERRDGSRDACHVRFRNRFVKSYVVLDGSFLRHVSPYANIHKKEIISKRFRAKWRAGSYHFVTFCILFRQCRTSFSSLLGVCFE